MLFEHIAQDKVTQLENSLYLARCFKAGASLYPKLSHDHAGTRGVYSLRVKGVGSAIHPALLLVHESFNIVLEQPGLKVFGYNNMKFTKGAVNFNKSIKRELLLNFKEEKKEEKQNVDVYKYAGMFANQALLKKCELNPKLVRQEEFLPIETLYKISKILRAVFPHEPSSSFDFGSTRDLNNRSFRVTGNPSTYGVCIVVKDPEYLACKLLEHSPPL